MHTRGDRPRNRSIGANIVPTSVARQECVGGQHLQNLIEGLNRQYKSTLATAATRNLWKLLRTAVFLPSRLTRPISDARCLLWPNGFSPEAAGARAVFQRPMLCESKAKFTASLSKGKANATKLCSRVVLDFGDSPRSCAISVFSLTLTMRTQVSQICSKCFAALRQLRSIYDDLCQTTWCSRSSWRWCFPGWTTASQLLPAFRSNSRTGFSLCRTPLHGWSSKLVVRTTFSRYCADYTGFGCRKAFRSGWQC